MCPPLRDAVAPLHPAPPSLSSSVLQDDGKAAEKVSKTYPLDFRMQVVATFMWPLSDVAFRRLIVHKLWLENRGCANGNAAVEISSGAR
jgi:hypothetical protein